MVTYNVKDGYVHFKGDFSLLSREISKYYNNHGNRLLVIDDDSIKVDVDLLAELRSFLLMYRATSSDYGSEPYTDPLSLLDMLDNGDVKLGKPKIDVMSDDELQTLFKMKLSDVQMKVVHDYAIKRNELGLSGMLLDGKPGVGKTFMAEAIAEYIKAEYVFVAAPLNTLVTVWLKSINEDYVDAPSVTNMRTDDALSKFNLINYERIDEFNDILPVVADTSNVMLIVDEVHNMTGDSKRTRSFLDSAIFKRANNILLLSGTPIRESVEEVKVILRILHKNLPDKKLNMILDNTVFDTKQTSRSQSVHDFSMRNRYNDVSTAVPKDTAALPKLDIVTLPVRVKQPERFLLDNVSNKMRKYSDHQLSTYRKDRHICYDLLLDFVRRLKDSPLKSKYIADINYLYGLDNPHLFSLGELLRRVRYFEENILFPSLSKDELTTFKNINAIVKYPHVKANGDALGKVLLVSRIECFSEMADAINYTTLRERAGGKVLIFSSYIGVCETVCKKLDDLGFEYYCGFDVDVNTLDVSVKRFSDEDNDVGFMVATYKSLSTGVRLTSASTTLLLDVPYRAHTYEQAVARTHRLGQVNDVTVIVAKLDTGDEPNLSTRNIDIIKYYDDKVAYITGNDSTLDVVGSELDPDNEYLDVDTLVGEIGNESFSYTDHNETLGW